MLYWLAFSSTVSVFNVFRYLTVRTGGAMFTAALFVFMFGPWIIDHLRVRQGKGQPIREGDPQSHLLTRRSTPTKSVGLVILSGVAVATVLWANPLNTYLWSALGVTICFCQMNLINWRTVGLVIVAVACFGLLSCAIGNSGLADSLQRGFVRGAGELAILFGAVIGAGLGFLNATERVQG